MTRPRLALFSLGGTIAMTGDKTGGLVPALTGEALVAAVPALDGIADIAVSEVANRASANLSIADIARLADRIEAAAAAGARGIIVTQGTDTLAECAFLLGVFLRLAVPVIVTGAMRSPSQPSPDGPANLLAAAVAAGTPALAGCGVLVAMNDTLHAARFVEKRHSTDPAAFAAPDCGPVGHVVEGRVRLHARPLLPPHLPRPDADAPLPRVALVAAAFDDDGALLDHLPLDTAGVVLEAFGAGHLPAAMADRAARLAPRIPVVFTTRTGAGSVLEETYGYKGAERDLIARGLIPAGGFSAARARLLLILALAAGGPRAELGALLRG